MQVERNGKKWLTILGPDLAMGKQMRNFALKIQKHMPTKRFTAEQQAELAKMMSGTLYDASANATLLELLAECHDRCHTYNQLLPGQHAERAAMLRQLLGRTGERMNVISPFLCDYGFNIAIGEDFFANTGLVILDEAPVTFGDHVFIGPRCGFYTAAHPLDVVTRNAGKQYSLPIVVGSNVWIGAGVNVMPGVTIGDNVVIGAGSVVTHDIAPGYLAVGNPCRPMRRIEGD